MNIESLVSAQATSKMLKVHLKLNITDFTPELCAGLNVLLSNKAASIVDSNISLRDTRIKILARLPFNVIEQLASDRGVIKFNGVNIASASVLCGIINYKTPVNLVVVGVYSGVIDVVNFIVMNSDISAADLNVDIPNVQLLPTPELVSINVFSLINHVVPPDGDLIERVTYQAIIDKDGLLVPTEVLDEQGKKKWTSATSVDNFLVARTFSKFKSKFHSIPSERIQGIESDPVLNESTDIKRSVYINADEALWAYGKFLDYYGITSIEEHPIFTAQ